MQNFSKLMLDQVLTISLGKFQLLKKLLSEILLKEVPGALHSMLSVL